MEQGRKGNEQGRGSFTCPLCRAGLVGSRGAGGVVFECPGGHVYSPEGLVREYSRTAARLLRNLAGTLQSSAAAAAEVLVRARECGKHHLARYLEREIDETRRLRASVGAWIKDETRAEAG